MFDIAFSEMLIIAVIALVVIGPEKLPKVAKTVGHLLGKAQRYVSDVKSEINREIEIDELRKLQAEMQASARQVENDLQTTARDIELMETEHPSVALSQTPAPQQSFGPSKVEDK